MPPVVIAAGVAGAAAIGGAVLSSKAQKKAASKAADVAQDNTAANNTLAREMYANNASRLDPYSANGLRASNALTDMLLGPAPRAATPAPVPNALTGTAPAAAPAGPLANILAGAPQAPVGPRPVRPDAAMLAKMETNDRLSAMGDYRDEVQAWGDASRAQTLAGASSPPVAGSAPPTTPAAPSTTVPSALSAWDQFRNSTNYQFREQQGLEAIAQGAFAQGWGQSGAEKKALIEWNQNFAANELARYQDLLAGQQGMGLTAASALAGVGQGMVGQVTANNNAGASAAANAALVGGQANANMYGGIASGIGQVAGALGSSYRPPAPSLPPSGYFTGGGTNTYFASQPYGY